MKTNDTTIRNQDGTLTEYGFACGYIEQFVHGHKRLELSQDGCWHVKAHNDGTNERIAWDCFDTLGEARARFDEIKSQIKG